MTTRGLTVYISIGNSDDKLTQVQWSSYVADIDTLLMTHHEDNGVLARYGFWLSSSDEPWQNACWCVELDMTKVPRFKEALRELAGQYRQDSIAWAPTTGTIWLGPVANPAQETKDAWGRATQEKHCPKCGLGGFEKAASPNIALDMHISREHPEPAA